MGEIADMVLDGTMCQGCGEFIDDEEPGYPRYCEACSGSWNSSEPSQRHPRERRMPCPDCSKRFATHDAYLQHWRDKHGPQSTGGSLERR